MSRRHCWRGSSHEAGVRELVMPTQTKCLDAFCRAILFACGSYSGDSATSVTRLANAFPNEWDWRGHSQCAQPCACARRTPPPAGPHLCNLRHPLSRLMLYGDHPAESEGDREDSRAHRCGRTCVKPPPTTLKAHIAHEEDAGGRKDKDRPQGNTMLNRTQPMVNGAMQHRHG